MIFNFVEKRSCHEKKGHTGPFFRLLEGVPGYSPACRWLGLPHLAALSGFRRWFCLACLGADATGLPSPNRQW